MALERFAVSTRPARRVFVLSVGGIWECLRDGDVVWVGGCAVGQWVIRARTQRAPRCT